MSTPRSTSSTRRPDGGLQALTSCAGFGPAASTTLPAWSPDGTKIVFIHADDYDQAADASVNEQVWVMDADGANPHRAHERTPPRRTRSPTGVPMARRSPTTPAASAAAGSGSSNANGSNQHQLTGCVAADPAPCAQGDDFGTAWSPDGTKIAFLRDYHSLGINDRPVCVMNADGSHQQRLTGGTLSHAVPAWQAKAPRRSH